MDIKQTRIDKIKSLDIILNIQKFGTSPDDCDKICPMPGKKPPANLVWNTETRKHEIKLCDSKTMIFFKKHKENKIHF